MKSTPTRRKPLVIGHRGAAGLAPENTLAAFKLALALGVDGVEFDVQLSADARAVVIHDLRVDRTTGARGLVSKLEADALESLDAGAWFYRRLRMRPRLKGEAKRVLEQVGLGPTVHSPELIPSLKQVLALIAPSPIKRAYIELKGRPKQTRELLPVTIDLIRAFGKQHTVRILSFDHQVVRRVRTLHPSISTAALFPLTRPAAFGSQSILEAARRAETDEVALHFGLVTPKLVEALHSAGISVSVWTVNSKLMMRRVVSIGVDAIMTDFPNRLVQVVNETPARRLQTVKLGAKRLRERLRSAR